MPAPNIEDIFYFGASIMGSVVNEKNNTISITTGDAVTKEVTGPKTQFWQQVGFASRPALAAPGLGAAQSINIVRANGDISIATRDLRDQAIYGNLSPGETCVYATGTDGTGQARITLKKDGSVTLSTTTDTTDGGIRNTDTGAGVYLRIDADKLSFMAPWGKLIFDRSGFHVQTISGAAFDLSNSNLPPPVGGSNSARITSSSIVLDAPNVCIGPSPTAGGIGYMPAVFGIIPPVAPSIPILGTGVGAVTVAAASSTKVLIGI